MDTPPYPATLTLTACTLDLVRGLVDRDGELTSLTARERALLRHLAARPNEVVSRDELLQEVWGYSEKVISRAVDKTVNRLRARIEQDRSQPQHLLTEYGVGFQLVTTTPAVPTAPRPSELAGHSGRLEALDCLREALGRERLITVVGLGGMGKTQLIKTLLPAAPRLDASLLTASQLEQALDQAQGEPWVVVECAEVHLQTLKSAVPRVMAQSGVRLVVTSLRPLHLHTEWTYQIEALSPQASAEMLLARAGRLVWDWGKGAEGAISALAELSGGWPLAIEQMASRARVLTPKAMAERGLPRRGHLDSALPLRHQSLDACLERSFSLLEPSEQETALELSIFRSPPTLEAIQSVLTHEDWLERIGRLSDWGLVWVSQDTRVPRMELFGPLRAWLLERLQQPEHQATWERLSDRHLRHFALQAKAVAEMVLAEDRDIKAIRRIRAGRRDLEAALATALRTGETAAAIPFADPLMEALLGEMDVVGMERVLSQLEPLVQHFDPSLALTMQLRRCWTVGMKGDHLGAEVLATAVKKEAVRQQLAEPHIEACHALSMYRTWGFLPGTLQALEEGLAATRRTGLQSSMFLTELGWHHTDFCHLPGRQERAEAFFQEAEKTAMAENNQMMEGMAYFGQATLAHLRGDQKRAAAYLEKAIPTVAEMGRSLSGLRELQGRIALANDEPDPAVSRLRLALRDRLREGFRQPRTQGYLARAILQGGQTGLAATEILEAERLARQTDPAALVEVLYHRVHVDLARSDRRSALAAQDEAHTAYKKRAEHIDEVTRLYLLKQQADRALEAFQL